jgi:hypothetical protein
MADTPMDPEHDRPAVPAERGGVDESEPLDDAPVAPLTDEDDTKGG